MQNKTVLSILICLAVLISLASASSAQAQWPEHSVLAVLPPPVATPSDALAAFLFRMETILDQSRPSDPVAYNDYLVALLERIRQIRANAPHAESPAERVVIEGVFALFSELLAERAEREMADVTGATLAARDGCIDAMRGDARENWEHIASITDTSPEARAWVVFAEARVRALTIALARWPSPVVHAEHRAATSAAVTSAIDRAARSLIAGTRATRRH